MRSFIVVAFLLLSTVAQAQTNQVCSAQLTCPPPAMTATYLDSNSDMTTAGSCAPVPDGKLDAHFLLTNLYAAPAGVYINGGGSGGGVWKWPCTIDGGAPSGYWMPFVRYNNDGTADVWMSFWKSNSSYTITVTYSNGLAQIAVLTGAP